MNHNQYSQSSAKCFKDEVQDVEYMKSGLYGDRKVEEESLMPVYKAKAEEFFGTLQGFDQTTISLSGGWLMKESHPSSTEGPLMQPLDSTGVKESWFKAGFDRSNWRKVKIPATVQHALVELGEISDPFWNTNTYDELVQYGKPGPDVLPWHFRKTRIEQKEWWFAKSFKLSENLQGSNLRLYFDGIDYSCTVYLNGYSLGYHAGMFGGPCHDITRIVKFDEINELVVRIYPPPQFWHGVLKGSPGYGWHYGHLISMGIWRDVRIEAVPAVELKSPFVKTKSLSEKQAVLDIEYYIESKEPGLKRITVVGEICGKSFESAAFVFCNNIDAPFGCSRYRTEIAIENPKVWWPMSYGKQNMYEIKMTVYRSEGGHMSVIDTKEADFGIRIIEMKPFADTKEVEEYRWQFVINGQTMFIKGANWCWTEPMLELDAKRYERFLEMARRAGIQMLRAWGGGIIETDEFYRLCNEKGIMVYQEFPFCWGPWDSPATDLSIVDRQVSQVVKHLRNHPSLVMWGGGNENVHVYGADEGLFLVGRRCRQYDPTRPYHRTDPEGGSVHNWNVFHRGWAIDSGYREMRAAFYGEYGLPGMTNRGSIMKYLPEQALEIWPPEESSYGIIAHLNQFSLRDLVKVLRYADFGPVKDWDDYIEYSQMAQGDALRFAAEMQRGESYDKTSGFWFYKFTDLFPGHSWSVVDFYGTPKLSYYRAKQVCRPRTAFLTCEKLNWSGEEPFAATIHAANDTPELLEDVYIKAKIFGNDLKEFWSRNYSIKKLLPNTKKDVERIEVKLESGKIMPFIMGVSMQNTDGQLLSDQWYWFNFQMKTDRIKEIEKLDTWQFPLEYIPEAFAAYSEIPEARLLNLPCTTLEVSSKTEGNKGFFTIRNKGDVPAFNVIIENFPDEWHSFLDDNSFCLWPGEERCIGFELGEGQSVQQVGVRAWNALYVGSHYVTF